MRDIARISDTNSVSDFPTITFLPYHRSLRLRRGATLHLGKSVT
jgi:hypothetical protein